MTTVAIVMGISIQVHDRWTGGSVVMDSVMRVLLRVKIIVGEWNAISTRLVERHQRLDITQNISPNATERRLLSAGGRPKLV